MNEQRSTGLNKGDKAILVAALFWGTVWYPVRELDAASVGAGSLPMAISYGLAAVIGLFLIVLERHSIQQNFLKCTAIGFFGAFAYTLYVEALLIGQVGRVLILFYLMPVWATLLERVVLGHRLSTDRIITLIVGFLGLLVIVGPDAFQGEFTTADVIGILAGMSFAVAVFMISETPSLSTNGKAGSILVFTVPTFVLVTLIPEGSPTVADGDISSTAWLWMVLHAFVWFVPAFWLSIYGANLTQPGRAAIFFMAEVLIGVATAAAFAGEILSAREAVGAFLVITAGLVEGVGMNVLLRRKRG